ncbi:MAG: aminoacyl-histidine dipeptidase [Microbacter sp.]
MTPSRAIEQLEPKAVWNYFKELTKIPRPSGKRDAITQFLVAFGQSLQLETFVDEAGNVIIRKPAMSGMEDRKGVILQAHMDMVPQKNVSKQHDFEKDPIDAYIDGDWVTADGTTLGADNGIGVASIMAILASKEVKHGLIEALFTADEETGMFGAMGLKEGTLKGQILLNLDSEDEGELYVGCAGGIDATIHFNFDPEPVFDDDIAYKISLTGLRGGHSGLEINEGRGNANKLLFRLLKDAVSSCEARLSSFEGGNLRNAIPRESFAVITIPEEEESHFLQLVSQMNEIFKNEYGYVDPGLTLKAEKTSMPAFLLPEITQDDLINSVTACHNGVLRFIPEMPEVVEASSNLSIVKTDDHSVMISILIRSSVESTKEELCSMIESTFLLAGAKVEFTGSYPGWNPNFNSQILNTMKSIYQTLYNKIPEVKVIHAGLECGIIGSVIPGLDMISFGPTIRHPHSPDEKVNIPSVMKFWNFLLNTLENTALK